MPPADQRVQHHLGVGVGDETDPIRRELGSKVSKVVDLAVEDQHEAAVGGDHRLVSRRGEVEHRQATEPERRMGVAPVTLVVGAASFHQLRQLSDRHHVVLVERCSADSTNEPTHPEPPRSAAAAL